MFFIFKTIFKLVSNSDISLLNMVIGPEEIVQIKKNHKPYMECPFVGSLNAFAGSVGMTRTS